MWWGGGGGGGWNPLINYGAVLGRASVCMVC